MASIRSQINGWAERHCVAYIVASRHRKNAKASWWFKFVNFVEWRTRYNPARDRRRIRIALLSVAIILFMAAYSQAQEPRVTIHRDEPIKVKIYEPLGTQEASGSKDAPASVDLSRYAVKLSVARKILASGVNTSAGIVTCEHVVRGYSEFTAECDGETATAKVVWFDGKNDVALLSVKWSRNHEVPGVETTPKGVILRLVGRGDNGLIRETSHKFLAVNEHSEVTFTDPRNSGASGSGLFNESGELVAIFNGAIVDDEPYIGRAITIDKVPQLKPKAVAASSLEESIDWIKYDDNAIKHAGKTGKPLFVFITAKWCGHCVRMKSGAFADSKIMGAIQDGFIPVMIDVDEHPKLAADFAAEIIPQVVIVGADYSIKSRNVGYKSTAEILAIVEKYR